MTTPSREAQRQQMLVGALWRDVPADALRDWLRTGADAGLQTYRANAGALAERALAGAFPTVAALVGAPAFAALARDFWQQHAPACGDIGEWGAALPAFIAGNPQLASEPYLADSAAVDWRVHQATRADDAPAAPLALALLGSADPERLHLRLAPGAALMQSAWPVAAIRQAHQAHDDMEDRFAAARAAIAARRGDNAFVWRDGHVVRVEAVADDARNFMQALIERRSLAQALDLSGSGFAFDRWLVRALSARWIAAIHDPEQP